MTREKQKREDVRDGKGCRIATNAEAGYSDTLIRERIDEYLLMTISKQLSSNRISPISALRSGYIIRLSLHVISRLRYVYSSLEICASCTVANR
jgi:hypothetical protein